MIFDGAIFDSAIFDSEATGGGVDLGDVDVIDGLATYAGDVPISGTATSDTVEPEI